MFGQTLTTEERLRKARVELQDDRPFWAYLVLKLKFREGKEGELPEYAGMGVNKNRELIYSKQFIDEHDDRHLQFFLAHEVSHLMFTHLYRCESRDPKIFNVACDIIVNKLLMDDGFDLPDKCLKPNGDSIKVADVQIDEISKKTAESIYDEIVKNSDQIEESKQLVFDMHDYSDKKGQGSGDGDDEEGEGSSAVSDMGKEADDWKNYMSEAITHAKQRGIMPAGMESVIGDILNPKLNWKHLLRRYITNTIPHDYTFKNPNMKIPHVILPGSEKESIDVVVHIDTSGSISDEELQAFMSEVLSVCNSFRNINMTLIQADMEIQRVDRLGSHNKRRVKDLQVKGRGGTSHKPVWEYINNYIKQCRILISLTDLGSDIEPHDKPRYDVIWVVPKADAHHEVPFGKKVNLDV